MTQDADPAEPAEPIEPIASAESPVLPDRRRRTLVGLALIFGGALLGMLALTVLPWFRGTFVGILTNGSAPPALRSTLSFYAGQQARAGGFYEVGIARSFFSWLGLVLLAIAVLAAVVGVGSDARTWTARVTGGLAIAASAVGLVVTAFALQLIDFDPQRAPAVGIRPDVPEYTDYLANTGFGAWAMVLGFLAIGAGAVLASGGRDAMRALLADEPDLSDEPETADEPEAATPEQREDEAAVERENW